MSFSLAPLRYWDVFADRDGPIEKVWVGEFPILGEMSYQASARLRPGLVPGKPGCSVYGNNDGTGSSPSPSIAQHMAISEALERWALYGVQESGEGRKYAFDIDPSSNGMAAYPGFRWQARARARLEALERFALIGWWHGCFGATRTEMGGNIGVVRIHHGTDLGEVALIYRKSPTGYVAYGHAASSSMPKAVAKAAIEMVRTEFVIGQYHAANSSAPVTNSFERRALHFSTPEGHAEFLRRLTARTTRKPAPWRTIFDGEVEGPWSRWATVWRHAVELPSYDFLNPKCLSFFW
jgi:hypothetical protein